MHDEQAIPLLIRVRELRPLRTHDLDDERKLVELATNSRDLAALMPVGWLDRQFDGGRVLLLLDGLDETGTTDRDEILIPWLVAVLSRHANCQAVISSRPAGFPFNALRVADGLVGKLHWVLFSLEEFGWGAIVEFLQNWCTQVRLARNETVAEATRGGMEDAESISSALNSHPPVMQLAGNPLLLSAICLVYHFEGGRLPDDRAVLYRLCVEGLLDRWDAQKGLRSPFIAEEKLRVCRELAVAMLAKDMVECTIEWAQNAARDIVGDKTRADELIEYLYNRAGLLTERTPGKLAFAHLTFQEYLTAVAIRDENQQRVSIQMLAKRHIDQRWREVILLYCRLAPPGLARQLLDEIRAISPMTIVSNFAENRQPHPASINRVSVELLCLAFRSCSAAIQENKSFRQSFLRDLFGYLTEYPAVTLGFEVRESSKACFDSDWVRSEIGTENSFRVHEDICPLGINAFGGWLFNHPEYSNAGLVRRSLLSWRDFKAAELRQVVWQFYCFSPTDELANHSQLVEIWKAPLSDHPSFHGRTQSEAALFGLAARVYRLEGKPESYQRRERRVFEHVPEDVLLDLLETYDGLKEKGHFDHTCIFCALFQDNNSMPSTPDKARRFTSVCTSISDRLLGHAAQTVRNWVASVSSTR